MKKSKQVCEKQNSANGDKLFLKKRQVMIDFNFGKDTAVVFDDMLNRSVPLYKELQKMIGQVASRFAIDNTNVYDLGCSTGITMLSLYHFMQDRKVKFIGLDYSKDMLDKCKEKLSNYKFSKDYELKQHDLNNSVVIKNASVVVLNLTLQFVRPIYRERLIKEIYDGLNPGGCLIVVEKVLGNNSDFNRMFIDCYYDMKRENGYSDLEIAQKREALENVLIPYSVTEDRELLKRHGFNEFDIFYKWYNFCGMVALK
ncbi:carboxy-S-adenosyl-L-methionine synthase CmoA [bacterium]